MIKRSARCLFLCVSIAQAAPTAEQFREATLGYVRTGTQRDGVAKITGYLSNQLASTTRIATRELGELAVAADCARFLQLSHKAQPTEDTAAWILGSGKRLHLLIDTLDPRDKPAPCMEIIDRLRLHDPAGCDDYYELILAIAVVFDRPSKSPIHGQMGGKRLPYDSDPVECYDYFKALYSRGDAKIGYEKLGAAELVYVVQVPVPLSELEWARRHVDCSLAEWGSTYSNIQYDHARLQESRYAWDNGLYTLAEIQRLGGICVDQAYFAVMTARAFGIPAIYFHGSGKSANHAWFSFMKAPGDWVLDVGRYQGDNFTTGYAVNPQTRSTMTDHDVEYACERSLHSDDFVKASAYTSIAEALLETDSDNALRCAREARQLMKRHLRPWEIEQQLLAKSNNLDGLVELFAEKKAAFKKYPDILAESAKEIEILLRKAGRNDAADRLVRSLSAGVDDERDDLKRSLEAERIDRIVATGDTKKARKELEQLLDDQKKEGSKTFALIRDYIELTQKSGQAHEAVKFLEDYIEYLLKENKFPPGYEQGLLSSLHQAYINDGNTKDAAKVMTQIERLNYR